MDLNSLIKEKRSQLTACKTIVTNTLGERYEIVNGTKKELTHGVPFVVDDKPDLHVACVIPGLFLSSQDPAADIDILHEHKIRHILSIGVDLVVKFDNIKYYYYELLDLPDADISVVIGKCIKIIHENRCENILVHCNAGVSRSAAVVISYLMAFENLSYDDAYDKLKKARNCIKPNQGFVKQLKALHLSRILSGYVK